MNISEKISNYLNLNVLNEASLIEFEFSDIQNTINRLYKLSIKDWEKLAATNGYLKADEGVYTFKFEKFYFGSHNITARYYMEYTDENEDADFKTKVFVSWDGSKYSVDFSGTATKI